MGKALVIKGADFSTNAVDVISELYEDITDSLINGFISISSSTAGPGKMYNASYNNTNNLIPNYLVLMENSTTLFDTSEKGVEWFIPQGMRLRCWAYKKTSTIASNGDVSDSYVKPTSTAGSYIDGAGQWIKASDIYSSLGVSAGTYPCYMGTVARSASDSSSLSLEQAKALGVKVRKLKDA